jgi:hypothetical protein
LLNKKKNIGEVTKLGLILAMPRGRSYKKEMEREEKTRYAKNGRIIIAFTIVSIVVVILILGLLSSTLHINIAALVTYNALVIAAAVFLLTYHLTELRDTTGFYKRNKDRSNVKGAFDFWITNESQDAAVRIVEVKAFYMSIMLVAVVFLMVSSFIAIASLESLSFVALGLSIISSIGIVAILILTLHIYLEAAVKFASDHPFNSKKR